MKSPLSAIRLYTAPSMPCTWNDCPRSPMNSGSPTTPAARPKDVNESGENDEDVAGEEQHDDAECVDESKEEDQELEADEEDEKVEDDNDDHDEGSKDDDFSSDDDDDDEEMDDDDDDDDVIDEKCDKLDRKSIELLIDNVLEEDCKGMPAEETLELLIEGYDDELLLDGDSDAFTEIVGVNKTVVLMPAVTIGAKRVKF